MHCVELLRSKALFGGLDDKRLEKVASFLKTDHFKKSEVIIREAEAGDRMYLIVKGSVEITKHQPGDVDEEEQLAILKEGDSFGEMELIDIQPRSATVRALTDIETVSLCNKDLLHLSQDDLEAFSIIIINIARIISRRCRKMDNRLVSLLHQ